VFDSANNEARALAEENAGLRERLEEAEDTLRAIRCGEVDALTVRGEEGGERVFTLQGAEHPYRVMVETMSEGALVVTVEGLILFSNRRFGRILREPLATIVGTNLFAYLHPKDRPHLSTLCAQGRVKAASGEVPLLCPDGTVVQLHLALSPLEFEGLQGVCIVATDLTQVNEALRQQDSLKQANEAKDQFLAKLSHELRTPLTPVLATVTAMDTQAHLPDEVRADIELIRRNVELEVTLIDDLLDVTRISRGILKLYPEALDVHGCLQTALEICKSEIEAKQLNVFLNLQARQHYVWADPTRLRQVFWNLLRNAVKFTPDGGMITIRTQDADDRISVQIIDTGIGIEPDFLPHIFDLFEQGDRTRNGRYGGLGLGLSITKAIVEMHDGTLVAFSEGADKGAVFTVELTSVPAPTSEPAPSAAPSAREATAEAEPLRILLVEDHSDTMQTMAKLLRRWGHVVTTADCVRNALKAVAQQPLDLLISDLGLPDGSGLDIMRRAKEDHNLRGIALSGYGTEEDARQSRNAGFDEHLVKPVSCDALRKSVLEFALRRTPT